MVPVVLVPAAWLAARSLLRWHFWSDGLVAFTATTTPTKILLFLLFRVGGRLILVQALFVLVLVLFLFLFDWSEVHIWNIHIIHNLLLKVWRDSTIGFQIEIFRFR